MEVGNKKLRQDIARHFGSSMDHRLQRASRIALQLCITRECDVISLELFIAALHKVIGKKFLRNFDNPAAVTRMSSNLALRNSSGPKAVPSDLLAGAQFNFIAYDEDLSRILWNAIRIAIATGERKGGVRHFIAALCVDDDLVASLKDRLGFSPTAYLGRMIRPVKPDGGGG